MQADLESLQGTWNIVEFELEGQKLPAAGSKIVVAGDNFTTIAMGAQYEGTVALDPAAKPKSFELHFNQGPEKGNVSLGIYELEGDTWTICLGLTGKNRPLEFATKAGSGHALERLHRANS
jgi:uncharacterized protein (TIGR03067 family)